MATKTMRGTMIYPREEGETATTKTAEDPYGETVQFAAYVGKLWPFSEWGACGVDDTGALYCDCLAWERTDECRHARRATRLGLPISTYWYPAVAGPQVAIGLGDGRYVTLHRVGQDAAHGIEVRAA